jgi:hypothetical protein
MKRATLAVLASFLLGPAVMVAATGDVTAPINQCIDAFNTGDMKSFNATYASGDIVIVDEFAPHRWIGPHVPQTWAADYDKHALATGVSDGNVQHGVPTRTEIEGDVAYVIVPTVYTYKEHGRRLVEEGQMTFVLHAEAGGWKIRSWTWSGVKPHSAK